MKTSELIDHLHAAIGNPSVEPTERLGLQAALRLVHAAHAAGFVDDDGEVRTVLGTLPMTADGCFFGQGADLWYCLPSGSATDIVSMTHSPYMEAHQPAYSTQAAALAARGGNQ